LPKLRVGIVNFLNSKPLAWGFLKGHHADLFAPSYHPPALVARLLSQGNLDVGLIPSIEVQRIPGLRVLPDLCIAATQEVRSVLMVSKVDPRHVRKVALDQNSRTSVALLRILLRERFGIDPEIARELCVEAEQARRAHGGGRRARVETLRQAGVGVVEGDSEGHVGRRHVGLTR